MSDESEQLTRAMLLCLSTCLLVVLLTALLLGAYLWFSKYSALVEAAQQNDIAGRSLIFFIYDKDGNCLLSRAVQTTQTAQQCDISETDTSQLWKYDTTTLRFQNVFTPTAFLNADLTTDVARMQDTQQMWIKASKTSFRSVGSPTKTISVKQVG